VVGAKRMIFVCVDENKKYEKENLGMIYWGWIVNIILLAVVDKWSVGRSVGRWVRFSFLIKLIVWKYIWMYI